MLNDHEYLLVCEAIHGDSRQYATAQEQLPKRRQPDGRCWEDFDQQQSIANQDAWRRVDRASSIYAVSALWITAERQRVADNSSWKIYESRAAQRTERISSTSDGLRRWLIAQCKNISGVQSSDGSRTAIA